MKVSDIHNKNLIFIDNIEILKKKKNKYKKFNHICIYWK